MDQQNADGELMRYIFWFWLMPMAVVWSWVGLSYYDMSFGLSFLSRETHDFVFGLYAYILGIDKSWIYWLLIRACVVDTAIIFAIYAYRRRKEIKAWWASRKSSADEAPKEVQAPAASPAE